MNKKILIIHGPNLNLLGKREPEIYGFETLAEINKECTKLGNTLNLKLDFFQSNFEGAIIEHLHKVFENKVDMIIINPAALTHTSIALRDALLAISTPFIEVHLSNIFARESFRHNSFISDKAIAVISGLGSFGYTTALNFSAKYLNR